MAKKVFSLICPIPRKFLTKGDTCTVNQLFGENRNALFYGPKGHQGIDIRTKGPIKWIYHNLKGYTRAKREKPEENGLIPIKAMHDGYIVSGHNDNKRKGIYMKIKSGDFESFYFHLDELRIWKSDGKTSTWETKRGKDFVKAGTIIGWAGNTGRFTTGAHLHIELRKKGKRINPMPYFRDGVKYIRAEFTRKRVFLNGKEI